MRKATRRFVNVVAFAAIALGIALPAFAGRRAPAMSGIAQNPAEATCFGNWSGNITNNCSGTRRFCLPLPWDYNAFGNWANVSIAAKTTSSTTLTCHTAVTDKNGNVTSWSGLVNLVANDGFWHDIAMAGGGIPDQGGVYTCCDLPQGGSISVIQSN